MPSLRHRKGGIELYYEGVCRESGKIIYEEEAFDYALSEMSKKEEQADYKFCHGVDFDEGTLNDEDARKEFVEWFFSGNWIRRGN